MKTEKRYRFKLQRGRNTSPVIFADSEESARRKLIRRRQDYGTSYAFAYQATLEKVEELHDTSIVDLLNGELKRNTVTFKETFLKKAKKYIVEDFDNTLNLYGDWDYKKWIDKYGREVQNSWPNDKGVMKVVETYIVPSTTMIRLRNKTTKFLQINKTKKTYNEYIKAEVGKYSEDFDNKLFKLATRLETKGFKEDTLKVTSDHIGVNFDCWVEDKDNKVHAYTIIAEGPIQRPHYRYLIK